MLTLHFCINYMSKIYFSYFELFYEMNRFQFSSLK